MEKRWIRVEEDLSDPARPKRWYFVEVSESDTYLSESDSEVSESDALLSESDTRSDNREIIVKRFKRESSAGGTDAEAALLLTKRKRKLVGEQLHRFTAFWDVFGYKQGKAEAGDAWLDLPWPNDPEAAQALFQSILAGARQEANNRPGLIAAGRTPKMAQGWLAGRRWEDEPLLSLAQPQQQSTCPSCMAKDPSTRHAHYRSFATEDALKGHFAAHLPEADAEKKFADIRPWWRDQRKYQQWGAS
jgi:hypothetical protein